MDSVEVGGGSAAIGPEVVRRLRGTLSRAAFARVLSVTPQTVYRWELPDGAAEARRPRGTQLERLLSYARDKASPEGRALQGLLPSVADVRSPLTAAAVEDDDTLRVLPALDRVFHGDLRRGHAELVQLVAQTPDLSANARARAYYGIALCELCERSDARAALLLIGPALNDAETGRLDSDVAAKLFAVAAHCYAAVDGLLFDLGRVHAYQARVERLTRDANSGTDLEAACLAVLAALSGASVVGDVELLERVFACLEEARWNALPPLLAVGVQEFRLLRDMISGKAASAVIAEGEQLVAQAEGLGYVLTSARTLGKIAAMQLESLGDPEQVLLVARRARMLGRGPRIGRGVHETFAMKAELEALLRLGRIPEALEVAGELDAWMDETGMPAFAAITALVRLWMATGRMDCLQALSVRLRSYEQPAMRGMCRACAGLADACAALFTQESTETTLALFEQAESDAMRWPFLMRDVLLYRTYAHMAAGQTSEARVTLRRMQRLLDRLPSPWFTAQLRRIEGGVLAASGYWTEARQLLQAASATFELAKDRCDALMTRYLTCLLVAVFECGEANENEIDCVRSQMHALGLMDPRSMQLGVERMTEHLRRAEQPQDTAHVRSAERLVVPFQRVAMRGAAPNLILSELAQVVFELLPGRTIQLEELDSEGRARVLYGLDRAARSGSALADAPREPEWIEFSDGAGRLLRLGVLGPLDADGRATLSLLTTTAALALEVAVLRSVGERAPSNSAESLVPELPGFVAASTEMRALRAELSRLARSRSTVIITGESGTGKEIVARAIHDLSERANRAYIAFNCATVPRELFEGQLFGYRRGSFTGATSDHPGVIRSAHGGTLFLDEIGELPLDIQPKLLRFLENSEVFPLGERAPVHVDVRVLAATHRDLTKLVREGRFREDLYYRLQVVPVVIPALRERRADIPVLARHFLRELTPSEREPPVLAPDALAALLAQQFAGNVRELKNIIERALAYFPDQVVLKAEHLRLQLGVV